MDREREIRKVDTKISHRGHFFGTLKEEPMKFVNLPKYKLAVTWDPEFSQHAVPQFILKTSDNKVKPFHLDSKKTFK